MLSKRSYISGFTYIWVLIMIAAMTIGLAAIGERWSDLAERQRRSELEWVGQQFVQAIGSYYQATPGGLKAYPPNLGALLEDPRFPFTRRHLRRIYVDPYTLRADWTLVRAADGGVIGIVQNSPPSASSGLRFLYVDDAEKSSHKAK